MIYDGSGLQELFLFIVGTSLLEILSWGMVSRWKFQISDFRERFIIQIITVFSRNHWFLSGECGNLVFLELHVHL